MYCQLGSIVFENLKTFNEFTKTAEAVYAEHSLVDGKPRLQRTGLSLAEIDLSIRLHVSFCSPLQELDKLRTARDEGEILPLLYGNGKVKGNFVITSIVETVEEADSIGNVFSYVVAIILREYIIPDKLQVQDEQMRNNAKAVGDKKPVAKKKINPDTCPQTVTGIISQIKSHAAYVDGIINKKVTNALVVNAETKAVIKTQLKSIETYATDLQQRCADKSSCANRYPDLNTSSKSVQTASINFANLLNAAVFTLVGQNSTLQATVKSLLAAGRPLSNDAITRK